MVGTIHLCEFVLSLLSVIFVIHAVMASIGSDFVQCAVEQCFSNYLMWHTSRFFFQCDRDRLANPAGGRGRG